MIERGNSPLKWAVSVLEREIGDGLHGVVSFTLQNGLIVRGKVEKSELPPVDKTRT